MHGTTWAFYDDGLRFDVYFRHTVGKVDNQSELVSRSLVVFAFDAEVHLVSELDFLVALSKTLVNVAFVALLCGFELRSCVSDCFCEPLFPLLFERDWAREIWLRKVWRNRARGS